MKKRIRVGVFDSGIGGLTVLSECIRRAPYAEYYYLGDNRRAPYGNRSEEEVLAFTREALLTLKKKKADAVVIACNTATAIAADAMRKEFTFPVVGVEPAVKPAACLKSVLVLATERTVNSARVKMLLSRFPDCEFHLFACRELAGSVEKYFTEGEPFLLSAHLPKGKYDGVVLGCTHYSFFAKQISEFYSAPVYDGNEGVAKKLVQILGSQMLGKTAHSMTTQNPNNCFSFSAKKGVKFLGKCRKINKTIFLQTFVLEKHEKK